MTKPFLPPLEQYCEGLKEIWDSQWLTNNGPILKRYTEELRTYFKTNNICLFTNGTLALQIALQGMGITGEVITTPFTFVATTHALYYNKIRPVFCDIEPGTFTINPVDVEKLITPLTTAILAVHVFGRPCRLTELADIAKRNNLTLIYDAAHAFGVRVNGHHIGSYGDLSMFSFHATKMYHSIEGGMLTFNDPNLISTFDYLKNFGFKNEVEVVMPGTNAKMNEMQALMGSLVLQSVDKLIAKRKQLYEFYRERLTDVPGIRLSPDLEPDVAYNYAYMPILIDEKEFGMGRDALYMKLKEYNVFTRRYFYPLLNNLNCYKSIPIHKPLLVAEKVAEQILTLPIYNDLSKRDLDMICSIINSLAIPRQP